MYTEERFGNAMKLSQLKAGQRYWFSSGYYIYSGLYGGEIKMCGTNDNVPLAILHDRSGNEWAISPDMLCLCKNDAVKRFKQSVRG